MQLKIPLDNRMRSFELIWIRINDPRSLGLKCVNVTDESTLGKDSSIALLCQYPSNLGSLILVQIVPKKKKAFFKVLFLSGMEVFCQTQNEDLKNSGGLLRKFRDVSRFSK